jgi:hypothetical protein
VALRGPRRGCGRCALCHTRRLAFALACLQDVWEYGEALAAPARDVKSRVAGMLEQERHGGLDNSWDEESGAA